MGNRNASAYQGILLGFQLFEEQFGGRAFLFQPFCINEGSLNKPQAEENVNSRLYSRGRSSNKPYRGAFPEQRRNLLIKRHSTMHRFGNELASHGCFLNTVASPSFEPH